MIELHTQTHTDRLLAPSPELDKSATHSRYYPLPVGLNSPDDAHISPPDTRLPCANQKQNKLSFLSTTGRLCSFSKREARISAARESDGECSVMEHMHAGRACG